VWKERERIVIVGFRVNPNNFPWCPVCIGQGVGKRDCRTEAFDRSMDIGAEEYVMSAVGKQD
jgi:hypothetical protein